MERVMVFIDGSNLYHGLKNNIGRTNLNFEEFVRMLCGSRTLTRIHYYSVAVNQARDVKRYADQQKFFSALGKVPYLEIHLGHLAQRGSTFIEKGVDVQLAVDMLTKAASNAYDTAILVSGDGDFAPAAKAIKSTFGKHIENAYFKDGTSFGLRLEADRFIELNAEVLTTCWLK